MRLEARGIAAGYGSGEIIRGIDLRLDEGEFVGLIGPNGSGKSTLLRALSRVIPLTSGELLYEGKRSETLRPIELARRIAFVPQSEPAIFEFAVVEAVLMGRNPYVRGKSGECAEDYAEVARAMAATDVLHLAGRPITQLSGGEHRRVLIARALAQRAKTLLLDEPTAHLDPGHLCDVLSIVRKQVDAEGVSCLAAFHDLNAAAAYCDRLLLITDGMIHAEGRVEDVIRSGVLEPAFGEGLEIASVNGRTVVLPSRFAAPHENQATANVHVVCGGGSGAEVLSLLHRQGHRVTAGVLNEMDNDQLTCAALGIEHVRESPYSPVSAKSIAACETLSRDADYIVVTAVPFGPGNLANLELVNRVGSCGKQVILLNPSTIDARDFTGGMATHLFRTLIKDGASVVDSIHTLPHLLNNHPMQLGDAR